MFAPLPSALETSLRNSPAVSRVLDQWAELAIPHCWLAAGVVVQSYWNDRHRFPPIYGISDVDLVYFDSQDLTENAESCHASRIGDLHQSLGIKIDVKNEARVHLWYESRFGFPIKAYTSVESAIETFPTTAGAIGVRPKGNRLEAFAPFGFDDLMNLIVRPNKRQITRTIYADKVNRWMSLWPRLNVIGWDEALSTK